LRARGLWAGQSFGVGVGCRGFGQFDSVRAALRVFKIYVDFCKYFCLLFLLCLLCFYGEYPVWEGSAPAVFSAGGVLRGMGCVCGCEWCRGLGVCAVMLCVMLGYLYVWCDVGDRGAAYTLAAPYVGGRVYSG